MSKAPEMTGNMTENKIDIPDFASINRDPEEELAADENVKALFHQLGYLDRSNQVVFKPETASGTKLGSLCKVLISRLCGFLLTPLIREQNRINLQVASCLREQLHQINELTAECRRLKDQCGQQTAECSQHMEQNEALRREGKS